jgi:hypothetical protein
MNGWRWHCRRTAAALSKSYAFGTRAALANHWFTCRHVLECRSSVCFSRTGSQGIRRRVGYEWHQRRFSWYRGLSASIAKAGATPDFGIPNSRTHTRRGECSASGRAHEPHGSSLSVSARRESLRGDLAGAFVRNGIENEHLAEQRHHRTRDSVLWTRLWPGIVGAKRTDSVLGGRGYIARRCCSSPRVAT